MPDKRAPHTAAQKDSRRGPQKSRKSGSKSRLDMTIELAVTSYSVREYPGRSSLAPSDGNYAGKDLAYIILEGQATTVPPGINVTAFFIHFVPDGMQLSDAGFSPNEEAVEMIMNWCQFHPLLEMLRTADSVQALYSFSGGVSWADVEGQFKRK